MSRGRVGATPITLRARHVLPIAANAIENGWVRIERGRIAGVGRGRPSGPVHDLGDAIILPGLVNAHTHLEFSDLDRPLPGGGGLPAWIERVVAMRRSRAAAGAVRPWGCLPALSFLQAVVWPAAWPAAPPHGGAAAAAYAAGPCVGSALDVGAG